MSIEKLKPEKTLMLAHRLWLSLTSLAASSAIAASPTFAATLASSEAEFELFNLSHRPATTSTFTDIDSSLKASPPRGVVEDSAQSIALFPSQGTTASSNSFSSAFGEGSNYSGEVLSEARVRGTFSVEADEAFSFDFGSFLDIETSIDDFQRESATAAGDISFLLLDNTDSNNVAVLDDFVLFGLSSSDNTNDFLDLESSDNITLTNNFQTTAFGGNDEFASAFVAGSFERFFASQTELILIEVQTNNVSVVARPVSVPEANFSYGYLVFGAALALKRIFLSSDRKI
jgi:hypothetical protein